MENLPLTHTPFLMTHDAASGYLGGGLVNAWTKTQLGGLRQQLDCGARAFDARPLLSAKSQLIWHHGAISIDYPFANSLADIIEWAGKNPTELVLLLISDCSGAGCSAAVDDALRARNVTSLSSCNSLRGLTYGVARTRSRLPNGGSLLAVTGPSAKSGGTGCSIGNYEPSMACTGFDGEEEQSDPDAFYGCWKSDATHANPIGRMLSYLDSVASHGLSDTYFTQHQALWQESDASVAIGALRNSSLVRDELESGLNGMLAAEVRKGRWAGNVSLFEVNDVCDGGSELLAALREQGGALLSIPRSVGGGTQSSASMSELTAAARLHSPTYRLPNQCLGGFTGGLLCHKGCKLGGYYTCDDGSECTCYDLNAGCGHNASLPAFFKGRRYCGFRTSGHGELCGWCAATDECTTRAECPMTPPAPPAPPLPPPSPRPYVCASKRPECNVCPACCKAYLSDPSACAACVKDECHSPPPPVPCANSTYNVTPVPDVLSGPCTCLVSLQTWTGLHQVFYSYARLNYRDNEHCVLQLPLNGTIDAPPFFSTEYQHDVVTFNGVNYSGVNGEIGGFPSRVMHVKKSESRMRWHSDGKVVGGGWRFDFWIPEPRAPPDPSSEPRVYSGACHLAYRPGATGMCSLSSEFYPDGIVKGESCLFIVPQGWYVANVKFAARSPKNVLTIGGRNYSGDAAGPPLGLRVTGLVQWDAAEYEDHDACSETKPFVCGFTIEMRPHNST